jgi:DNA-binding response OmpR family regulator
LAPLTRHRVLVVEDHDDSRNILARLLAQHYEVLTATNYQSALAVAARMQPTAIVTDIALGQGGNGIDLMRELRKTRQVYGIAVSGFPPENPNSLLEAGLIKWFIKPIQFKDLLEAVAEACAAFDGDGCVPPPISDEPRSDQPAK